MNTERAPSRRKVLLYVLIGLAVAICGFVVMVVVVVAQALDTDRDLADFESPAEARDFTSAHLPAPLPADAAVERLHYDHFTDWMLTASVRFPSGPTADRYLEAARGARTVNDSYCSEDEPPAAVRYFLADVTACGLIERAAPETIKLRCNTR